MGRYTAESTGMDVLRPIAVEKLKKNPSKKDRIWSNDLEAWGFFANDEVTPGDMFLLWCSISPGDRLVYKFENEVSPQISTVVGIWRESKHRPFWIFRLIDQNGRLVHIDVEESELFRHAWNS